jgi:hypothetical protein
MTKMTAIKKERIHAIVETIDECGNRNEDRT